jgi:transposase
MLAHPLTVLSVPRLARAACPYFPPPSLEGACMTIAALPSLPTLARSDPPEPGLRIGVDTHAEVHVAAAIDEFGRLLATTSVPTSLVGLRRLHTWAGQLGPVLAWGIEGTGSYGARLARLLVDHGETVLEVSRPDRRLRRDRGKSDPIDAEAAARAVLAGTALGVPKAVNGPAASLRPLRAARQAAVKARTQAVNQLRALLLDGPEALHTLRAERDPGKLATRCARLRPATRTAPVDLLKHALRSIAGRWLALDQEISNLDKLIAPVAQTAAPAMLARPGVGPEVAAALLITAGDNPHRLANERSFAALCGASPLAASSGKTTRHRLNRGGDRQANRALHVVALSRMQHDPRTRAYVQRRTNQGMSRREIMRCLKRYIARELFPLLLQAAL